MKNEIMKARNQYPKLDSLFGACFNQDWKEDYNTPEAVIQDFAHMGGRSHIEKTIHELKILLKEKHSSQEWENVLYDDFGCGYYFDYEEQYTPKEWLEKVLQQLEEELLLAKDD